MKPIFIKDPSALKRLLPLVQKTRRWSWKYFERMGQRLVIDGGRVFFLDAELMFPEHGGYEYTTPLFWNGPDAYEVDTSRLIASLLKTARLFIDVGSNIGIYAVYAGVKHPDVLTYAFEPVPEIWKNNVAFHKANGLPVERVLNLALSDDDQPKKIFIPIYDTSLPDHQTATLRSDSWQADNDKVDSFEIQCTTLDFFASQKNLPPGPCLLKIDVENYEGAVLRGGHAFISQRRPWIVCEILPCEEYNRETKTKVNNNRETMNLLDDLRYTSFAVTANGMFRMTPGDFARPRELKDFLLIPSEKLAAGINYLSLDCLGKIPA